MHACTNLSNPLQMNDWPIKKFLILVFSIQFSFWGISFFNIMSLNVPFFREIISFVYLTYIPGMIILRIFKLHNLGNLETILYAIGLSISSLMFVGFFTNLLHSFLNFSRPISSTSLLISISIYMFVLSISCYFIDKDFSNPSFFCFEELFSPLVLSLLLIPFLTILGTFLMNFYGINILIIFSLFCILLVIILLILDILPQKLYSFSLFIIAISILFHTSLISTHLWGYDIHSEYFVSHSVIENSLWDLSTFSNLNSVLSLTLLVPIFSCLCGISEIWIFKIVIPFIFSLVPLGLYRIYQIQTDNKTAFLACFFFMSFNSFFTELVTIARQEIAELFLVLLILLMVTKSMSNEKRSLLNLIFGFSLIVSHYASSYIYLVSLISSWLLLFLVTRSKIKNLIRTYGKFFEDQDRKIAFNFVLLFVVTTISWYMFVSNSSSFIEIVKIGKFIVTNLFMDFLNPATTQGLALMTEKTHSFLQNIHKIINYLNQIFILIGILTLFKNPKTLFKNDYISFSIISLLLLIAGVVVPHFASSLNMTRLYHMNLFFLAPFCVIGGVELLRYISKTSTLFSKYGESRRFINMISIYFILYFSFQTGLVDQLITGNSSYISLNNLYDSTVFSEQEVLSAKWLSNVKNSSIIYSDYYRSTLLTEFGDVNIFSNNSSIPNNSYIYFGRVNAMESKLLVKNNPGIKPTLLYVTPKNLIKYKSQIYDSKYSSIYY